MKRVITRERRLPAFSLGIGELETLWARLVALFEDPERVYISFEITLSSEKFEFKSLDELKQYSGLQGSVTNFSLWFGQADRHISLRSSRIFSSRPQVSATGETEAWCAGAVETAYSFLLANKLWYSWFVTAPLGWVVLLCACAPAVSSFLFPKVKSPSVPTFLAWLGITATLAILYISKDRLLPASVLVITQKDGFLRRHAAELSLIVAIASLVLTVIGWFAAK